MLDPLLGKWREQNGGAAASWSPTLEGRYTTPLAFQPGERFGYGPGLDWAGRAVELVSHKTLGEYFQDHIFAPLGVKNASFFPNKDPALKALMVDLNPEDPHGIGLAPMGGIPSQGTVAECFGGQGLYMPAAEYIKVLYSLLASDGKLLSPKTVDMMFEPSLESAAHTFVNTTFAEEMANSPMGAGMPKETQRDYALGGLLVQTAQPGSFAEGTMVWGGAFNSAWFIDRKTGLCGFGAPQPYLRDGPATRGEGYVFKPHREGAMRWEKSVEHFKIVYRKGIYQVYQEWKERK
jgi:CubicO group peptidase (beta-lactamase class C family)